MKNPVVANVATSTRTGGLAFQLLPTGIVVDISDIMQFFVHDKSSSILELIIGKSILQKLLCLLFYYQLPSSLLFLSYN